MRLTLLFALPCLLAAALRAQGGCQIQSTQLDIPYDTVHPQQVLDLFHPSPGASDSAPVVVWLPGGFTGLQPATPNPCAVPALATLLSRGFALVMPDLRPMATNPFPAAVFDCARVVQTIRLRAAEWNVDPQRIFLMGRSTGGAIAASVAYGLDMAGVVATDPAGMLSSRPTAVYLGSAVSNFFALSNSIEGTYFGQPTLATVGPNLKLVASPNWWVTTLPQVPIPSYLVYKGAIGTLPLADSHDAWSGLDYGISLLSRGATVGFQYFPSGIDGTNFDAVASWFLALYP
jgi:acetyl esterase/lipase